MDGREHVTDANALDVAVIGPVLAYEPTDPIDTLLEAHAVIVGEVRARATQPDIDSRELAMLARGLTGIERAIEIIADGGPAIPQR